MINAKTQLNPSLTQRGYHGNHGPETTLSSDGGEHRGEVAGGRAVGL